MKIRAWYELLPNNEFNIRVAKASQWMPAKEVVSRSSSLVSRRNRADHANERSTTQCLGKSTKPFLYSLSNGRRDIVAQSDENAAITWTAGYEAFGKRPAETDTRISQSRAWRALKGRNSPIENAR